MVTAWEKNLTSRVSVSVKKGLTEPKTMVGAKMPHKVLLVLNQALVNSVMMEYGLGLLTLFKTHVQRLEMIQNEGMRAILDCTKDTSAEAMRYLLKY